VIPTAFDEENLVLNPPLGVSMEECPVLSVYSGPMPQQFSDAHVVISCWKPTKEEMQEIIMTGRVYVVVWGRSMPPICPVGFSPFRPQENTVPETKE
jgi:hypothetical protein